MKIIKNILSIIFFFSLVYFLNFSTTSASTLTIDSTVSNVPAEHNGSSPTTVFTNDQTGYTFYVDGSGKCVYSKTTNGGASWGTAVEVDSSTSCLGNAVWYDQWTPGDTTGTVIHIATFIAADVYYRALDTNGDTFGAAKLNISGANQGGAFTAGSNVPSITKATNGVLYVGIVDASDSFVLRCSTSCGSNISNWTEAGTNPYTSADGDWVILLPLPSGDVFSIWWDASASDILSREYEDGANAWQGSWLTVNANAEVNTIYDSAFAATLNKANNDIYLVYADDANTLGAGNDDIKTATYDGTSWTNNTDVITNDPNRGVTGVSIGYGMNNNDIYVGYTVQETTNYNLSGSAYVARSTDGMTSWSSEIGQFNTTSDDIYAFRLNLMNDERIYATWYRATPDDLFGSTVVDLSPGNPYIYVGQDGSQTSTLDPNTTNDYLGGAFTFIRTSGTADITSIKVTDTGTLGAYTYLSNLDIYYETSATCTYNGTETLFGTASSFNSSNEATVTGTMSIGTSQVCVYLVSDIASGAIGTIEPEISDPSADVVVSAGVVPGAQRMRLQGVTNVRTPGSTNPVTIDSTVKTTATYHLGASPTVVFTTDQIGYSFYVDQGTDCKYSKTTNGGTSWGAGIMVDSINTSDCLQVAVWYDQWTPGDNSGTLIHVGTIDSGSDDGYYTTLDTSTDTLSTTVDSMAGQGFTLAAGTNGVAITKATNGAIFMGINDSSDSAVFRCSAVCNNAANWAEAGTNPFTNGDDGLILLPLAAGDVMAIWWDISADDILSKVFEDGAGTWDGSWTTIDSNTQDNTIYDSAFAATLNKANNDIYLAYIDTNASSLIDTGDDEIKTWKYSSGSWTAKGNVTTNDTRGLTQIALSYDMNNNNLYVIYSAITDVLNFRTGAVYYKSSSDQMATWGPEQGSLTELAEREIYGVRSNIMNADRIYVTWVGAAADDLFGNTVVDLTTTTLGNGTDGGNSTIGPGASATEIDRFSLVTDSGTDTVTGMTVTLAGDSNAYQNIATVDVQTIGGSSKCSLSPSSNTVLLTSCAIGVTTSSTEYKIMITPLSHASMPAVPGASYATTATVTSITATNFKTGTDSGSATITVDNASAGAVSSAIVSAGDTVANLAWTNPGDGDFDEIVVLRSTSAVTNVPIEGSEYSVNDTIGSATVACNTSTTSCQDTGLSNGTDYYYKIFTQDSRGNYDAGVVPTGSPVTPFELSVTPPTYVGGVTNSAAGTGTSLNGTDGTALTVDLTSLSGGSNSSPSEGDLVIIALAIGSAGRDHNLRIDTAGYSELSDLYADDNVEANLSVFWKIMGATPDTTVTLRSAGNTADSIAAAVHVWRGVDQTIPFDITHTIATGLDTGRPTPSAITPITEGSIIIPIGAGAYSTTSDFTSDLDNFVQVKQADTNSIVVGMGSHAWTSGTYTPSGFGGNTTNALASWAATTLALRPEGRTTSVISKFNLSDTSDAVTGWTNVAGNPSSSVRTATDGTTSIGFRSITTYWGQYGGANASTDNGATSTDGAGFAFSPNDAISSYWFNYLVWPFTTNQYHAQIFGLDSGKKYDVILVGSRGGISGTDIRETEYNVRGDTVLAPEQQQNTLNTSRRAVFSGVTPNGSGEIDIALTLTTINTTGSFSYLNAVLVKEVGDLPASGPTTCTSQVTSGYWNTTGSWDCGHVPSAGEYVVIDTGDTITMDVDSNVLGDININGTLNTSDGTSRALSGARINISTSGTLTANASTITLSGTSGTLFTRSGSGTFTQGTSTVILSGNGDANINSEATTFHNLTISGSGAKSFSTDIILDGALDISNASATLNINYFNLTVSGSITNAGSIDSFESDAQAFLTNASISDNAISNAITSLVINAKKHGWWNKVTAVYPFVGGTEATHKLNLKDPRDLDGAYRLTFTGGWTHTSTGADPNGTTGYADTHLIPANSLTLNDTHMSVYSRENEAGGYKSEMAVKQTYNSSPSMGLWLDWSGNFIADQYNSSTGSISTSRQDTSGLYLSSRINSSTFKAFRNNSQIGSTQTGSSGTLPTTYSVYISADNNAGTATDFSTREIAFASIGKGIGDSLESDMYDDVQAFQIQLGRAVSGASLFEFGTSDSNTISLGGNWTNTGTIDDGNLTIKLTSGGQTFVGGGISYNDLWLSPGSGTGSFTISGNNTFNHFRDDGSAAHSILFTTGSTTHVSSFNVSGSIGNLITINSTTTGVHNLVFDGNGSANANYLNIQHSVATPNLRWFAGNDSVNNQAISSAGSGWIFNSKAIYQGIGGNSGGEINNGITGSGAIATAVLTADAVSSVNIVNGGSNYNSTVVSFCGGGGTGATGVANINLGAITSVNVTNGGSGYTTPPTVLFSGSCGGGQGGGSGSEDDGGGGGQGGGGQGGGGGDLGFVYIKSRLAYLGFYTFNIFLKTLVYALI